jgi:hypothetical protein
LKLTKRRVGLIAGPLVGAAGIGVILLASGGAALASAPATVCSNPTSCVTGDPVLASVDVQSSTSATLTGSAMSFGTLLPGNTATGTETYQVGTNDAAGAEVTATWDDSMITGNEVDGLVTLVPTGQTSTGFEMNELLNPTGAYYDQGMVNLSTLHCNTNSNTCNQDTDIPWSALSVAPAAGAGGTAATFAYSTTGGLDPVPTPSQSQGYDSNNESGNAGQGGGSTTATVASFTGPVTTESLTDTYSLNVPSSQEAGIYAADLWYQVLSN